MEVRKKTLGEEHLNTLSVIANLAISYSNQGQTHEAMELQTHEAMELQTHEAMELQTHEAMELQTILVEISTRALSEAHHDTLKAVGNLAIFHQGRTLKTVELEVEASTRTLDDRHRNSAGSAW
jgi:hypothetical protein